MASTNYLDNRLSSIGSINTEFLVGAAAEEAEKRSEPHQEKVEHVRSYNRTLAEGESVCY
jgi:hypothetical protein